VAEPRAFRGCQGALRIFLLMQTHSRSSPGFEAAGSGKAARERRDLATRMSPPRRAARRHRSGVPLPQGGGGVGQVTQEVRERQRVEGLSGNGICSALLDPPPGGPTFRSPAHHIVLTPPEHGLGPVEPDDPPRRRSSELEGAAGRARGDIEDSLGSGRNDAVDHSPVPPPLLTERQHLASRSYQPGRPVNNAWAKRESAGWLEARKKRVDASLDLR
jgi:hypothetical protein